jgi:hypothetical protein
MCIFKSTDRKFKKIGFKKIKEDKYGATYERQHKNPDYLQRLDLMYKDSGRHIIQSYDPSLTDDKRVGNTCVGITMYEAKLCVKKMKEMGWKIIK